VPTRNGNFDTDLELRQRPSSLREALWRSVLP